MNPTLDDTHIQVHIFGQMSASRPQPRTVGGQPGERMEPIEQTTSQNEHGQLRQLAYHDDATGLRARSDNQHFGDLPITRQWVKVTNASDKPMALDTLYGAYIRNIPWVDDRRQFRLHVAHNGCHAEGQWRMHKLPDLGLIKAQFDQHVRFMELSRSSQQYLPMAMLEDVMHHWTLIWQIEYSGGWMWDLGKQRAEPCMDLALGGLDESHLHWYRVLQPGEQFVSLPVAFGCVEGDAEAALAAMVDYRRAACKPPHPVDDKCPVIFNDYMNCLLGYADRDKSLPLIPRACDAGCEIYVMDGGWYGKEGWQELGNWYENRSKFPNGLNEIFDLARDAGMMPGLWTEIEAIAHNMPEAQKPDDWFLSTRGVRNLFGFRHHLDFRHADVRAFADGVMDRVIDQYSLAYMKLDYNQTALLGTDRDADSPGDGGVQLTRAYYAWFDDVRRRHPQVIFENCASGGMRSDYGMLSRTQLASSSDQTNYKLYPSIAVGSAAAILPEQLAVWSYPLKGGDREEAIFNMVSSLLMRIHLSGQIWQISDEQFEAVREAVTLYKDRIRADIPRSMPFYPLGRPTLDETDAFNAFGLHAADVGRAWLAVWRLDTPTGRVDLPLPDALGRPAHIEQVSPAEPKADINCGAGRLAVELPQPYSARLFHLAV